MATVVLQYAGQAVGTFLGGSLGGVVGRAIGAVAGNYIDQALFGPGARKVEGPRLNDLRVMASTEGAPIPRLWGRMRVAGIPLENVPGSAGSTLGRELSWRSVALVHPGGTLGIEGDANGLATYAGLAAIQLVPLPEPAAGAALGIGCGALFALAARRGRRPSPTPSRLRDSPSRPRRDSDTSCRRD